MLPKEGGVGIHRTEGMGIGIRQLNRPVRDSADHLQGVTGIWPHEYLGEREPLLPPNLHR